MGRGCLRAGGKAGRTSLSARDSAGAAAAGSTHTEDRRATGRRCEKRASGRPLEWGVRTPAPPPDNACRKPATGRPLECNAGAPATPPSQPPARTVPERPQVDAPPGAPRIADGKIAMPLVRLRRPDGRPPPLEDPR
ncbi:hypothetical protein CAE01nite_19490 [Cellulomonas aerilata]|uniref:Uncharacterized protein n=1 Tax=Cellulomonas aerilata TaxID=515326 RepID=A0A512DCL1_9CELL|nr:hypothetical protein CAE01nite_19490 [Cellulomonas aerilata]